MLAGFAEGSNSTTLAPFALVAVWGGKPGSGLVGKPGSKSVITLGSGDVGSVVGTLGSCSKLLQGRPSPAVIALRSLASRCAERNSHLVNPQLRTQIKSCSTHCCGTSLP